LNDFKPTQCLKRFCCLRYGILYGIIIAGVRCADYFNNFINGGYFVFDRKFFNYLKDEDDCILEREPLEKLTNDGELQVYQHTGFWQCMDTYRDYLLLNNLWQSGPEWKIWK